MENLKTRRTPTLPQQLSLTFETEIIRTLTPPERRVVATALIRLMIEASGLEGDRHDER